MREFIDIANFHKTLYVARPVLNGEEIVAWAKSQGFAKTLEPDDLHVTICYSREPLDWLQLERDETPITIPASSDRAVMPLGDKGAIVLKFSDARLLARWRVFRENGASWDYEGVLKPHVSITYQGAGIDVVGMEPYRGPIVLGGEVWKPVNQEWTPKET